MFYFDLIDAMIEIIRVIIIIKNVFLISFIIRIKAALNILN